MTWKMFAQRRKPGTPGQPFYQFGRQGYAGLAPGLGVTEVELTEDSDGPYWAWLPTGSDTLRFISDTPERVEHFYRCGEPDIDMARDELAGSGRLLRLSARELVSQQ